LETGTHSNKGLQEEWSQFGKDAFSIDVLETLKKKDDRYLLELENKWLEHIQPYEESNPKKSINL
jgi:hypothetical protein